MFLSLYGALGGDDVAAIDTTAGGRTIAPPPEPVWKCSRTRARSSENQALMASPI